MRVRQPLHGVAGLAGRKRPLGWAVIPALVVLPWSTAFGQAGTDVAGGGGGGSNPGAVASTPLTVDYGINARVEFIDNEGFSRRSTVKTRIGPSATFRMDTETLKLSAGVSINAVHSSNAGNSDTKTSEPRFTFAARSIQERSSYGLNASFFRDNSFDATIDDEGTGFRTDAQRSSFAISPSYSYALTERLSLNASYGYNNSYYDASGPGLVDSERHSVSGGLSYRLTELDSISTSISQQQYRTSPDTTSSDVQSLQVAWSRQWTEITSTSLYVGYNDSEQRGTGNTQVCLIAPPFGVPCPPEFLQTIRVGTASDTRSPSYGFTVTTQLSPTLSLSAFGNRGVQGGGTGTLTERETLGGRLSNRFSERLSGNLAYTTYRSAFVGAVGTSRNRTQTLTAGVSYALQDNWSLNGGARISETDVSSSSQSRSVFVAISKTWPNNLLWR